MAVDSYGFYLVYVIASALKIFGCLVSPLFLLIVLSIKFLTRFLNDCNTVWARYIGVHLQPIGLKQISANCRTATRGKERLCHNVMMDFCNLWRTRDCSCLCNLVWCEVFVSSVSIFSLWSLCTKHSFQDHHLS